MQVIPSLLSGVVMDSIRNEIVENEIRGCMGMKYLKALDIHTKTDLSECMNTYEYYTKTLYGMT